MLAAAFARNVHEGLESTSTETTLKDWRCLNSKLMQLQSSHSGYNPLVLSYRLTQQWQHLKKKEGKGKNKTRKSLVLFESMSKMFQRPDVVQINAKKFQRPDQPTMNAYKNNF